MCSKSYSCDSCGRQYKNSKSLRTHRYSYHRSQIDSRNKDRAHSSPNDSVSLDYDYGSDYATKNTSFLQPTNLQQTILDMIIYRIKLQTLQ